MSSRRGLHRGGLAVGPHSLEVAQARHGRDHRVCAVREDDVVGGVAYPVDIHGPRAREPATASQQGDPCVGQPLLLSGVGVVRDHEVPPGQCRVDVDLGAREYLPGALDSLPRTQQGLRGDAREVGALAAHELTLHDRHPESPGGERACAVLAG
jgi:hypothetical protein